MVKLVKIFAGKKWTFKMDSLAVDLGYVHFDHIDLGDVTNGFGDQRLTAATWSIEQDSFAEIDS